MIYVNAAVIAVKNATAICLEHHLVCVDKNRNRLLCDGSLHLRDAVILHDLVGLSKSSMLQSFIVETVICNNVTLARCEWIDRLFHSKAIPVVIVCINRISAEAAIISVPVRSTVDELLL